MRRTVISCILALIALNCFGLWLLQAPSTHAKRKGYINGDLCGIYASQLTGHVNVPPEHPWYAFNGAYALTGIVSVDGSGNAKGTVYDNYNGFLVNYSWIGSYEVNQDGTCLIQASADLGFMQLNVEMFGVLCDEGRQVRLMHVGPAGMSPLGLPFVGTTVTGSWIRQ